MDRPIAAILILNTAAHTIGAAVAGASYSNVFDASTLWLFSILFTIAVLFFTEIIPKTLGVTYARKLAAPVAHGIRWLTVALRPLVVLSEKISRSLRGDVQIPVTTSEEIRLLATLGRSKGAVGVDTAGMIVGATQLKYLHAHDVMLPREDVRFLSAEMNRDEALAYIRESGHSRFPFTPTGQADDISGVVLAKELLFAIHDHGGTVSWSDIVRETLFVPETMPLNQLLQAREQLSNLMTYMDGKSGAEDLIAKVLSDPTLLQSLASSLASNHPEVVLIVLLIGFTIMLWAGRLDPRLVLGTGLSMQAASGYWLSTLSIDVSVFEIGAAGEAEGARLATGGHRANRRIDRAAFWNSEALTHRDFRVEFVDII